MIEDNEQATGDDDGFEDVEGEAPPVDEYRLSTSPDVGDAE